MKRIFKINKKSFCVSTAVIMLFLSIVPGAPSWFGLIDDVKVYPQNLKRQLVRSHFAIDYSNS